MSSSINPSAINTLDFDTLHALVTMNHFIHKQQQNPADNHNSSNGKCICLVGHRVVWATSYSLSRLSVLFCTVQ